MNKAADLLHRSEQLAATAATWADLSNSLFDPLGGLLAQAFPTREERREFTRTPEFRKIQQLRADAVDRFGLIEGARPTKITEFMTHLHSTTADPASTPAAAMRN